MTLQHRCWFRGMFEELYTRFQESVFLDPPSDAEVRARRRLFYCEKRVDVFLCRVWWWGWCTLFFQEEGVGETGTRRAGIFVCNLSLYHFFS